MSNPSDGDRPLSPSEELILEVLAARWRLGEHDWPFANVHRPAFRRLETRGLVNLDSGPTGGTTSVSLTDAGRDKLFTGIRYRPTSWGQGRPVPATDVDVQWGLRRNDGDPAITPVRSQAKALQLAADPLYLTPPTVVRRTACYGPWEPVDWEPGDNACLREN